MFMANATVSLVLPATRVDGSAFGTADYGGAHVFRDGVALGTVAAPALSFVDSGLAPGTYVYSASVFDAQVPPVEGAQGVAAAVTVAAVLAAPGVPVVTVTVA
jgi:hypothetical protein